jgi:hypothetical protein
MAGQDHIEDVLFVIESFTREGQTAYRVRSPNLAGLGVVSGSMKEAIDEATEVAGALRMSHGQAGPFNVQLEIR